MTFPGRTRAAWATDITSGTKWTWCLTRRGPSFSKEHRDLEGVDLVRFTFELDEAVEEIHALVSTVFG